MRVLTALPQADLNDVPAAARAAEVAGYDGLVTTENQHEPFLALGVASVNTTRVTLHTGIAIAFSRSPMPVANACWDLQVASRGRFVLGLGSQVRAHNERRFGVPWSAPAPRLREYVEALRAIWRCWETGEKLDYCGQHYTFTLMTLEHQQALGPSLTIPLARAHDHGRRAAVQCRKHSSGGRATPGKERPVHGAIARSPRHPDARRACTTRSPPSAAPCEARSPR